MPRLMILVVVGTVVVFRVEDVGKITGVVVGGGMMVLVLPGAGAPPII